MVALTAFAGVLKCSGVSDNETNAHPLAQPTDQVSSFDLDLLAPVLGGRTLARLDGQVVRGWRPPQVERVRAFVPVRRRGYLEAEARTLLGRSKDRVNPLCPYFGENGTNRGTLELPAALSGGVCGGCQYQHIAYAHQLEFKTAVVKDVLRRVGKIVDPPVSETLPSHDQYRYRNRAAWLVTDDGELAYREALSHTPVSIEG